MATNLVRIENDQEIKERLAAKTRPIAPNCRPR